jgi:hypothetical protein
MIKNKEILRKFEDSLMINEGKVHFNQAVNLFTAMWKEAVKFGVLPLKTPLEGIEVDIRIAKALNSCSKKSSPT